jgi:hypothetical protein
VLLLDRALARVAGLILSRVGYQLKAGQQFWRGSQESEVRSLVGAEFWLLTPDSHLCQIVPLYTATRRVEEGRLFGVADDRDDF